MGYQRRVHGDLLNQISQAPWWPRLTDLYLPPIVHLIFTTGSLCLDALKRTKLTVHQVGGRGEPTHEGIGCATDRFEQERAL